MLWLHVATIYSVISLSFVSPLYKSVIKNCMLIHVYFSLMLLSCGYCLESTFNRFVLKEK